jgi:hypothetical protein
VQSLCGAASHGGRLLMLGFGGNPVPTTDEIVEAVHRLLRGIAETIGHRDREPATLSPTTEMAYLEAERIRKARIDDPPER